MCVYLCVYAHIHKHISNYNATIKREYFCPYLSQPLNNSALLKIANILIILFVPGFYLARTNKEMDGQKINLGIFFSMHTHIYYLLDSYGNLTCDFISYTGQLISVSFLVHVACQRWPQYLIRIQGGMRLCRDCCVYYAYKVIVQKISPAYSLVTPLYLKCNVVMCLCQSENGVIITFLLVLKDKKIIPIYLHWTKLMD